MTEIKSLALSELSGEEFAKKLKELLGNREGGVFDLIWGPDGTREEVIEKYRQWILTQPHLMGKIHTLRGKTLGCWCSPQACHGDVLVELACGINGN